MEISSLGDAALIVRVAADWTNEAEAAAAALGATDRIRAAEIPGVIEVTPAYTTVGVFYQPASSPPYAQLIAVIRDALATASKKMKAPERVIEVPVCYDAKFAPDLSAVAEHARLSVTEVTQRHVAAKYRVSCIGFAPGFPYLSGLPTQLATPRRATPRTSVPAGSVAIGGAHTGIYPQASPGGWNIIGRSPLRLFDATRDEPSTLRAGDAVRFREISREEFERLSA